MQAWFAAAIARRPIPFLVANLAVALALAALALGAPDRLAVGGGLERVGDERTGIVVVLTPDGALSGAVARQALTTVESGLRADPAVADVEVVRPGGGRETVLAVTITATTATGGQEAAIRVAGRIDPGPYSVALGGEPMVQELARDELGDELPGLALLAAPLVLLVLGFAFGPRRTAAPVVAAATGALGGIALLRVMTASLDLTAAGIAVAVAVGLAVGIEACQAVRRAHEGATYAAPAAMLEEALRTALPRVGWACAGAALAAALLFAIPLPAARSTAVGGIAAALLAGVSAPVAMASVLALLPAAPPTEPDEPKARPGRIRPAWAARIADEVAVRPAFGWIPVVLVLGALGLATAQAFGADAVALAAGDLGADSEPARVAAILAAELPATEAEPLASGAERAAAGAAELFRERLPWLLGALTLAGLAAAYAASRSARAAIANGIGAALPAGAACGLVALFAGGSAPFELAPFAGGAHASVLLATLAALGAIGVARAALADRSAALIGTLVTGTAFGVLAAAELDAVAQLGLAIAAGLAIDLALVRAVLAPCLERALPARLA